ncbi:MAG: DUF3575 domain-containing protein [Alistipes sp.]|nr:DUF3575 domain-containing protein [Alistipes sp.]
MKKLVILGSSLLLSLAAGVVNAQETRHEFKVEFRAGSAVIEPDYADNARQLSEIINFVNRINSDSAVEIVGVTFGGTTSPEGSIQYNRQLSQRRLAALEHIVREKVEIPEHLISRNDFHIPWEELEMWVRNSDLERKQAVLDIIAGHRSTASETVDARIQKLRTLDDGRVWEVLNKRFFVDMRSASAVIVTFRKADFGVMDMPDEETDGLSAVVIPEPEPEPEPASEPEPEPEPASESDAKPAEEFVPHALLKTNVLGWGLAMANVAAEVDLCRHLSFALPIYYSAMNYFVNNLKFRLVGFQPELRAWLSERNDGLFFGAHFGAAWYDFAFMGKYRYQDHNGGTPALGGGVSAGYRLPIGKNKRWRAEFSVGGGAYHLHYDTFLNKPNGKRTGEFRKTYIGLDGVAVSFAYTFDMKKGGGR